MDFNLLQLQALVDAIVGAFFAQITGWLTRIAVAIQVFLGG